MNSDVSGVFLGGCFQQGLGQLCCPQWVQGKALVGAKLQEARRIYYAKMTYFCLNMHYATCNDCFSSS